MLGMATEPRQGFDPTDLISDVSARFEALARLIEIEIENLKTQPDLDALTLSHLQRAQQMALRGVQLTHELGDQTD